MWQGAESSLKADTNLCEGRGVGLDDGSEVAETAREANGVVRDAEFGVDEITEGGYRQIRSLSANPTKVGAFEWFENATSF